MLFVFTSSLASAAPAEREVARLEVEGTTVQVMRSRLSDGGLKLRLAIGGRKKKSSVVLYEGGGDDDGPGDKSWKSAAIDAFEMPDGSEGARIDFEFLAPGSKKKRQIDTFLVTLDESPRTVLEVTTHRERDASRVCHEVEQTALVPDKAGKLYARPTRTLDSDLDDEDSPIDAECVGKHLGRQVTYKYDGETFVQIDPPLKAPPKEAPSEVENDD